MEGGSNLVRVRGINASINALIDALIGALNFGRQIPAADRAC